MIELDIAVTLDLLEKGLGKMDATIRGVDTGFLQLLSPIYLHQDRKLEILYRGRRLRSTVVYCKRESAGAYDAGIKLALDAHVRSEPRTPVNLRTTLNISGSLTPIAVQVVDFSPSGLGIEVPKPIRAGATVSVDVGCGVVLGEIKHCTPSASHYRAGIRLQQFIRRQAANESASFGAFVRAIEGRQSKCEAILLSLAHSRSRC